MRKVHIFRRFKESCKWWDCNNHLYMEWAHEGGRKGILLSKYQRESKPLPMETYKIVRIKWMLCINLGGTAEDITSVLLL